MILYRWCGASTNFGDELNTILWPRLLPGLFDEDPGARFLGIGSVLDRRHPADVVKIVAGAGYGGYEAKPRLDSNWIIHWVRGPRTAAGLGLPAGLALGDPAILVPPTLALRTSGDAVGFMPHFESMARGAWARAAGQAGVVLIDPRDPPDRVLAAITGCRLLLSEALHGVIVADALRVPWVAIRPLARAHRAKWADWADTMGVSVRFQALPASTPAEWAGARGLTHWPLPRSWEPDCMIGRAAGALAATMGSEPQLSGDAIMDRCQSRMLDAVSVLAKHPFNPPIRIAASDPSPKPVQRGHLQPGHLQAGSDSAYQLGCSADR